MSSFLCLKNRIIERCRLYRLVLPLVFLKVLSNYEGYDFFNLLKEQSSFVEACMS
jgi:hypothetical protein